MRRYNREHLARARTLRTQALRVAVERSAKSTIYKILSYYLTGPARQLFLDSGEIRHHFTDHFVREKGFSALLDKDDSAITEMLKTDLASIVYCHPKQESMPKTREDADAVLALARHLRLEGVTDFELTAQFLDGYKRYGLVSLAIESRSAQPEDRSRLEKMSVTELKTLILDSKTRDRSHIPAELTFPRLLQAQVRTA